MRDAIIKKRNFWDAFEMMARKMGLEVDYRRLMLGYDVDAVRNTDEKKRFIRKVTRTLAFNYDVHRCPSPTLCDALQKDTPITLPPEQRG